VWHIFVNKKLLSLKDVKVLKTLKESLIWNTEAIAITFFKSLCKIQKNTPNRALKTKYEGLILFFVQDLNLMIPILPIFNNPPAKSIEPVVEASTWAFGSQ
jgi:hypothetical protein